MKRQSVRRKNLCRRYKMPESYRHFDDYDDEYVCVRILFDEAPSNRRNETVKVKEIANIMNNAIGG